MEEYRNGDVTDATLSVVPFTHSGTCGYDDTVFDGRGLIRQYDVNE
ncbi:MAG: hypothetical protein MR890_09130 [Akkermansia muciniphila]|nr:hypothetical protein [Akkermansia muciniphila]